MIAHFEYPVTFCIRLHSWRQKSAFHDEKCRKMKTFPQNLDFRGLVVVLKYIYLYQKWNAIFRNSQREVFHFDFGSPFDLFNLGHPKPSFDWRSEFAFSLKSVLQPCNWVIISNCKVKIVSYGKIWILGSNTSNFSVRGDRCTLTMLHLGMPSISLLVALSYEKRSN